MQYGAADRRRANGRFGLALHCPGAVPVPPLGERARREIHASSLVERGLLDYEAIDELWEAHRAGRGDWAFQLWNIYNVSAWYDCWVAGRVPAG